MFHTFLLALEKRFSICSVCEIDFFQVRFIWTGKRALEFFVAYFAGQRNMNASRTLKPQGQEDGRRNPDGDDKLRAQDTSRTSARA